MPPTTPRPLTTPRLRLDRPTSADLEALFAICSDPAVWEHYPSLLHTTTERTAAMMARWEASWDRVGLGTWVVRSRDDSRIIGHGGCDLRVTDDVEVWNLGYRLASSEHGNGFATEIARAGIARARSVRPEIPITAYLLEHNAASAHVVEKVGFTLVSRGPDAGNPDPSAVRLVYADRALTPAQLQATQR